MAVARGLSYLGYWATTNPLVVKLRNLKHNVDSSKNLIQHLRGKGRELQMLLFIHLVTELTVYPCGCSSGSAMCVLFVCLFATTQVGGLLPGRPGLNGVQTPASRHVTANGAPKGWPGGPQPL